MFGEGNLISNQTSACCPEASQDGMIALLTIVVDGRGARVTTVHYVPIWIRHPDFTVVPIGTGLKTDPADADALRASYARTVAVVGRRRRCATHPGGAAADAGQVSAFSRMVPPRGGTGARELGWVRTTPRASRRARWPDVLCSSHPYALSEDMNVNASPTLIRRSRFVTGVATALTAAAIVPAGAMAATSNFGSSLNHDPANAGTSCDQNNLDNPPFCTHVGSFYPGFSGHAQAKSGGTITKIKRPRRGPDELPLQAHAGPPPQLEPQESARPRSSRSAAGCTPTARSANGDGSSPVETFNVHIKVHKGDYVGIDTNNNTAEYCSDGTPGQLTFFNPDLALGDGFQSSQGVDDCLLLVQAVYNH